VKSRLVSAAAAVVLATVGLTACSGQPGAAAFVDNTRISQSEIGKYLTPTGVSSSASAAAASQGQQLQSPKLNVVNLLVQEQVWRAALAHTPGGVPSEAELAKLHDTAAATFLGTQTTGSDLDALIAAQEGQYGFTSEYGNLLLTTVELEAALVKELKVSSLEELSAAVAKFGITVKVSAVYGKWDPKNLSLTSPDAAVPTFITIPSTAASSPVG
jgi:hypothetical protein